MAFLVVEMQEGKFDILYAGVTVSLSTDRVEDDAYDKAGGVHGGDKT